MNHKCIHHDILLMGMFVFARDKSNWLGLY